MYGCAVILVVYRPPSMRNQYRTRAKVRTKEMSPLMSQRLNVTEGGEALRKFHSLSTDQTKTACRRIEINDSSRC